MARILSLAVGALALLTTTAVLCTQIILDIHVDRDSPGRIASIASAALESAVLVLLGWQCASRERSKRWLGIVFGLGIMVCTLAATSSIVALVYMSKTAQKTQASLFIASSVALGLSLPSQVVFMVLHFASARTDFLGATWSFHKDEETGRRSRKINLKSIRYSQTLPIMSQSQGIIEMQPTGGRSNSIGGKSTAETARSSMTSTSHAIRPASSRTRLLPFKEKSRSTSIDSSANRSSSDDTFDSWDTSAVDAHNRQAVVEISSPSLVKTFGLETIPASPMVSRSPSPDSFLDLDPLQHARNRSYSPASMRRELRELKTSPNTPGSTLEPHIHPLFRSDSPDPHPLATPGTSVVAAPDAARVIVHRASNRSLSRIRSGSLPVGPSPLRRHGSLEDARSLKTQRRELDPIMGVESDESDSQPETERKMTPPVPEWLLSGRARAR